MHTHSTYALLLLYEFRRWRYVCLNLACVSDPQSRVIEVFKNLPLYDQHRRCAHARGLGVETGRVKRHYWSSINACLTKCFYPARDSHDLRSIALCAPADWYRPNMNKALEDKGRLTQQHAVPCSVQDIRTSS
eukprot:6187082-Pleurochrysis_carterae.AAC.3